MRRCSHCGGSLAYEPIHYTSVDAYGAQQTGKHAGAAFMSGHPGAAVAHLAYRAAMISVKEFRKRQPYKCASCGRRSG